MSFTSPSNRQLTEWRKLLQGKYRKRENRFIAEGLRCVEQIIQQKRVEVESILLEQGFELPQSLPLSEIDVYELATDDFHSVSDTETPQGIIAVCNTPEEASHEDLSKRSGVLIAFDAVQDPGNLGTMIRTASWFNVSGLIFGNGTVDPFHPKVVRSTAGATGAIPYLKNDLVDTLKHFEETGWKVSVLDGGAKSVSLHQSKSTGKDLLIIGNEGNGVNQQLMKNRQRIRIDGNPDNVESLNAAVALSIALYQFYQ